MATINLYLNELKSNNTPKYILIGISSKLILDKILFKRNENLKEFIYNTFLLNEQFKNYVYDSRTILLAKVARIINEMDDKQCNEVRKNLVSFLRQNLDNEFKGTENENNNTQKVIWD